MQLGGGFGPGFKVAGGYDFVGDGKSADSVAPTYKISELMISSH